MLDTLDCRMVTASPMEGFLWATMEALNALWEKKERCEEGSLLTSFDNID